MRFGPSPSLATLGAKLFSLGSSGINKAGNALYLDDGLCLEVDKCSAGTWPDSELFVCRECDPLVEVDAKTCTPTAALTW